MSDPKKTPAEPRDLADEVLDSVSGGLTAQIDGLRSGAPKKTDETTDPKPLDKYKSSTGDAPHNFGARDPEPDL